MPVLSIDLASRDYADFGFCSLRDRSAAPEFLSPQEFALEDTPSPPSLAGALSAFCKTREISVLLLDGPQGWRWPASPIQHMRLCERVLNTPARTGSPGQVKPATYRPFVEFSIELFRRLRQDHGWSLLVEDWSDLSGSRWLVETFPSAGWELLGLKRLPGKSRSRGADLEPWRRGLSEMIGFDLPKGLSHDQLQAAVPIPAGLAIAEGDRTRVVLAGVDPIVMSDGEVFEGWIALPSPGGRTTDG